MKTIARGRFLAWIAPLTVALVFPMAMPSKRITQWAYLATALLFILIAFTRSKRLLIPLAFSSLLLLASFFLPLDVAVVSARSFGFEWIPYERLDAWNPNKVRTTGEACPMDLPQCNGAKPKWVLRVNYPSN
jgi:hypothetical protein